MVTHVTFQSNLSKLRWKVFVFYFTWNFSYVLTLLHFAHVYVNLYKIYDSHTERTSKLAGKDVKKAFINKQLELRANISSRIGQAHIVRCFLLFIAKSPGMKHKYHYQRPVWEFTLAKLTNIYIYICKIRIDCMHPCEL